nr:EOG090X0DBE [Cyclestheria hislopi]
MEFFDDPKNWGANEVKSGRSWTKDELRLKSNVDLHKLWYVLLKERNMLLTMEHASKEECELFPSPERLDKVKDSMKWLEEVIQERNEAYWLLEVGEPAPQRKQEEILDPNDPLAHKRRAAEAVTQVDDNISMKFKYSLKEQEKIMNRRLLNRQKNEVLGLLKRFPTIDIEALKAKYPDVDVEKLRFNKKTRGHHEFNTA